MGGIAGQGSVKPRKEIATGFRQSLPLVRERSLPLRVSSLLGVCRSWASSAGRVLGTKPSLDLRHSFGEFLADFWMDADADAQELARVNDLEASSAVQYTDYTLSMVRTASGRDLVRVVDLDHAAVCELERKGFEWYF
jgi:hypothetical protein